MERSDIHHGAPGFSGGFRKWSTHPTYCHDAKPLIALVAVAVPALSGQLSADDKRALPAAVSKTNSSEGDCEARMRKLDASQAEGEERLAEKNSVIDYCASQYKNDKTIARLVKECANTRSSQS